MSLGIYKNPDPDSKFITTSPFRVTFDGRLAGLQAKQVFVRNDDPARYYTNIAVQAVDTSGDSIVDNSTVGFWWKLIEKDLAPTLLEWNDTSAGNILSLSSSLGSSTLGDTVTYLPVWVCVSVPRGQYIQTITDVVLRITATENIVDG